jgi:peroxiredoxin
MPALTVGDSAPDVELTNAEGQPVRLSELWREQPIVLLFLRHFG